MSGRGFIHSVRTNGSFGQYADIGASVSQQNQPQMLSGGPKSPHKVSSEQNRQLKFRKRVYNFSYHVSDENEQKTRRPTRTSAQVVNGTQRKLERLSRHFKFDSSFQRTNCHRSLLQQFPFQASSLDWICQRAHKTNRTYFLTSGAWTSVQR